MSKIRVTWTNVGSTDFSDDIVVDEVLGLFDVEDRTPPWARNAIRRVSETVVWK